MVTKKLVAQTNELIKINMATDRDMVNLRVLIVKQQAEVETELLWAAMSLALSAATTGLGIYYGITWLKWLGIIAVSWDTLAGAYDLSAYVELNEAEKLANEILKTPRVVKTPNHNIKDAEVVFEQA